MALTKVSRGLLSTGIVDNSNATAITLNADESSTFAGPIAVTGLATASEMTVSDTDDIRLRFLNGTTFKAGLQVATSTGDMIAGSAVDDLAVRSQANMLFATGGNTERMRIDGATGGLLVGTTSLAVSTSTGSVTGAVINTTGLFEAAKTGTVMELNRLTADGTILNFRKDGTSVGSIGTVSNGLFIASPVSSDSGLRFSGSTIHPCTTAGAPRDAAISLGYASGKFKDLYLSGFVRAGAGTAADPVLTGSDGNTGFFFPSGGVTAFTQNGVERGRFDASGNFLLGKTATGSGSTDHGHVLYISGVYYQYASIAGNSDAWRLYDGSGTLRAAIDGDGDYHDLSDARYKENIVDAPSVLATIGDIQVRSFTWREDGRQQTYGFVAQELNEVVPEAVRPAEEEDQVWMVKHAKLVPLLTKAIQEQQATIEALTQRIQTLENN